MTSTFKPDIPKTDWPNTRSTPTGEGGTPCVSGGYTCRKCGEFHADYFYTKCKASNGGNV